MGDKYRSHLALRPGHWDGFGAALGDKGLGAWCGPSILHLSRLAAFRAPLPASPHPRPLLSLLYPLTSSLFSCQE